jgi:hypothetical protein
MSKPSLNRWGLLTHTDFSLDSLPKLRLNASPMETLDLSAKPQPSDGRFKSLFWPTIQSATDVDYLASRGYWVCVIVAVLSAIFLAFMSMPGTAVATFLLYYIAGVGVRERSPYAAAIALVMSLCEMLASGPSVLRVIFTALFLSNLRAAWISSGWKPDSEEAVAPPRFNETLADKLADQFPKWLWPKIRIPYFVFSFIFLALVVAGMIIGSQSVRK